MKHKVYGKHLGRDKNQRQALLKGLVRSLVLSESIITTEAKVKAVKGEIDRLISKSRSGTNASKRIVLSSVPQKEVSRKLLEEIAPRYKNRKSGFTTSVRMGTRAGDGAMMVRISLMPADQKVQKDSEKLGKPENLKSKKSRKVKSNVNK